MLNIENIYIRCENRNVSREYSDMQLGEKVQGADKEKNILVKEKLAHVDYMTKRCQSMREHIENVALFSQEICALSELKELVGLSGASS